MLRSYLIDPLVLAVLAGATVLGCAGGGVSDSTNNANNPSNNPNCPVTSCTVGDVTCAGTMQVVRCDSDGAGCGAFQLVMNCDLGATCNGGECQAGCIDGDGDQHGDGCARGLDCDDGDADRYYGAVEACDDKDNDCDGETDEDGACSGDCSSEPCTPGDRECVDSQNIRECRPDPQDCGRWATAVDCGAEGCHAGSCSGCIDGDGDQRGEGCALGADCDDDNASRYEGAPERCDGIDNDCDSDVDEDFPELGESCSTGIGGCQGHGVRVCDSTGSFTVCDATATSPTAELCGDGIDNDCDEAVDEGFDSLGSPCSSGTGACRATGSMVCNADGDGLECDAAEGSPVEEICSDGVDNDCNGQVDVDCQPQSCTEDGNEPNNTTRTATSLPQGSSVSGTLCGNTRHVDLNEDWFSLGSYSSGQTISVDMTFDNPDALHMELYTAAFKAASSGTSTSHTLTFNADVSSNYYIWVVPEQNPTTTGTDYTLTHH